MAAEQGFVAPHAPVLFDGSISFSLLQAVAWQAQAIHAVSLRGDGAPVAIGPVVCRCGTWCWGPPAAASPSASSEAGVLSAERARACGG